MYHIVDARTWDKYKELMDDEVLSKEELEEAWEDKYYDRYQIGDDGRHYDYPIVPQDVIIIEGTEDYYDDWYIIAEGIQDVKNFLAKKMNRLNSLMESLGDDKCTK